MRFQYLKDPLFITCFVVYWINRFAESRGYGSRLTESYLNDLIIVPFFLPMMLSVLRKLNIRQHDGTPNLTDILVPVFIWAVVFEVILPLTPGWSSLAIADPNDVACYVTGGLASHAIWRCCYSSRLKSPQEDLLRPSLNDASN